MRLVIAIALQVLGVTASAESLPFFLPSVQERRVIVTAFNPTGMPVKIDWVIAENLVISSNLQCSVTNLSASEINGIYFRTYTFDSAHRLVRTQDLFSSANLGAGASQEQLTLDGKIVNSHENSLVAITKVVGKLGVWSVDPLKLEQAVIARINRQQDIRLDVGFEPHLAITKEDRAEIFKLIVEDVIRDNQKAEKLSDCTDIIILRKDLNFELPLIRDVKLSALDHAEIQTIADEKGKVIYLIYEPFVVEGSHILARIALRDKLARRPGMYVPFGYAFSFTLAKKDRQWMIEKSIGYAQGVGYSK